MDAVWARPGSRHGATSASQTRTASMTPGALSSFRPATTRAPLMLQQTLEKEEVSTPIMRRVATTMAETWAGEGTGSGWMV